MRSDGVLLPPPSFDQDLGFCQGVEDLAVEQFIPPFPVEGFHIAVLPGTAWCDEECLYLQALKLQPDEFSRELRLVIRTNVGGNPMRDEQARERFEHVGGPQPAGDNQRETFPRILIDDRQDLQRPSIVCPRGHEVVGPDVMLRRRAQADARAVGQPQSAPLGLFLGHLQSRTPPQACDPFVMHSPPFAPQERRDPSIAVPVILRRELDEPRAQAGLVVGHAPSMPMR